MMRKVFFSALGAVLCLAAAAVSAEETADPAALLAIGHQQRKDGNFPQAIDAYQRALQRASGTAELEWQARTFLALTYLLAGNPRRASELDEQNLAFVRQHLGELVHGPMNRESTSIEALARDSVSLGDLPKAAVLLQQALALEDSKNEDPPIGLGKAKLTQKLGIVQFLAGDPVLAERTLKASLDAFETALKTRRGAGSEGEYEHEVEVIRWLEKALVAQKRTDEALEWAEKGRAREFAGLLLNRLGATSVLPAEDALTLGRIKAIAAAQRATVVEYSVLYQYDPALSLQFSSYTSIPASDILIWVIQPSGEIAFRPVKLDPPVLLAEWVRSARESLGARGRGVPLVGRPKAQSGKPSAAESQLRRLHELLIHPIADLLPTDPDARITFVPQDLLFLVPFAALRDDHGKFMVERHTLTASPSIQVLSLTRQQQASLPEARNGALVVGNPAMPTLDGVPLPNLPGAEKEAMAVAALLKTPALTGAQATKKAAVARMRAARLIHLATHGLLDDAGGVFSSIALAPSDGDSGFLTAREILALRLNAELVILSACDTGQGKITGDGVVGLSRAFIGAGASSVMVSLWAVPDSPTALLMGAFYKALRGGADKAQALRQAMLTAMQRYPSSVDWAAFTLIGDADASKTLKTGIASGMGDTAPVTVARYRVFPLPDDVRDYQESSAGEGEVRIRFDTSLTVEELLRFYRRVFAEAGLQEGESLLWQKSYVDGKAVSVVTTSESSAATGFSLAFDGSPNGKKLVVSGDEKSNPGTGLRSVSVEFE